jgi:hypothetical protein
MSFEEFIHVLKTQYIDEVEFYISKDYDNPYYFGMYNGDSPYIYWVASNDGTIGADFSSLEELSTIKVIDGKSLRDIWDKVEISTINGCNIQDYVKYELNLD